MVDDGIILSVALGRGFYWSNGMTDRRDASNTNDSMGTPVVVEGRISLGVSISFTLHNSSIGETNHAEKKGKMLSHDFAGVLL